jgi:hypothetical protein
VRRLIQVLPQAARRTKIVPAFRSGLCAMRIVLIVFTNVAMARLFLVKIIALQFQRHLRVMEQIQIFAKVSVACGGADWSCVFALEQ